MFWKYNSLTPSHLDSLLDKQGVTLSEILEQEDIIQECKSQNKKLVDYLTKQEILSELLDLILQEPPTELEERLRFKLPNIASEVITCDVPQINEKLSSDSTLLDKMYAFLEGPPPLNPLLTSFFSKAFGVLITRRPEQNWYSYQYTCLQVIEYIKVKEGFTGLLLNHIATSAVMDLLLRLITCVEGIENKQNILTWLNDERLIQRVLALLNPPAVLDGGGVEGGGGGGGEARDSVTASLGRVALAEIHDNAGQLLVEIIRVSRDAQITATPTDRFHNPLLTTAESPEMVQLLLGYMLDGPAVESTIVNGVEVLMTLLEIRRPAPQGGGFYSYPAQEEHTPNQADIDRQQAVLETTAECIIPRLPQLTALLVNPPVKPPISSTCGVLDPPLGKTRLILAKLISALLATNHAPINLAITQANTTTILLDLFFKYSLNNFLHSQVESCVHSIIFWKEKAECVTPVKGEGRDTSSLETPKILVDGDTKEDVGMHPLEEGVAENPALIHLLTEARLMDRLVAAWTVPTSTPNISYMGHITKISNDLVTSLREESTPSCPSRTLLLQLLAKLPEETMSSWTSITTGKLHTTNLANELKPATEEKRTVSSDDEDSDFRDIQFPQDSALQQMFSDYQMQEMSENFIDSFGFQDDEFTESEDNVSRGMRKLNSVNFLMQTDDSTKQAIFDSVCEQRIKAFSSPTPDDNDEDPWADRTTEITFGGNTPEVTSARGREVRAGDSSESDDDDQDQAPDKMEVDNDQDPWEAIEGPIAGPVAMDTSSPWGSTSISVSSSDLSAAAPKEAVGWADFGSASFSSGGGEGMGSLIPSSASRIEGVTMDGEREGWSPAMASSPEATMLNERSDRGEGTGSPVLEDRLQQAQDVEVASEDKGSYSGGSTPTGGTGGWCTAPTGGGEGGGGGGDGSARLESQGGEAVPGLNKDQEPVCDSSSQDCTEGSTGGEDVSS